MSQILTAIQSAAQALRQLPLEYPTQFAWYTLALRFLFPILAVAMLARVIRSLVKASPKPEIWAYLSLPNGVSQPLTHWENILGRSASCDGVLNYPVVSRQHAALIRGEDDVWTVYDLGSKSGTTVNGTPADPAGSRVNFGDVVSLGGVETVLLPVPDEEVKRRRKVDSRPVSPWGSLVLLTLLQVLTALQFLDLLCRSGKKASQLVAGCRRYPQVLVNIPVADKAKKEAIMADADLQAAISQQEKALAGNGRILVRPSGTEALIRVMVEAQTGDEARAVAEFLANVIKNS